MNKVKLAIKCIVIFFLLIQFSNYIFKENWQITEIDELHFTRINPKGEISRTEYFLVKHWGMNNTDLQLKMDSIFCSKRELIEREYDNYSAYIFKKKWTTTKNRMIEWSNKNKNDIFFNYNGFVQIYSYRSNYNHQVEKGFVGFLMGEEFVNCDITPTPN